MGSQLAPDLANNPKLYMHKLQLWQVAKGTPAGEAGCILFGVLQHPDVEPEILSATAVTISLIKWHRDDHAQSRLLIDCRLLVCLWRQYHWHVAVSGNS